MDLICFSHRRWNFVYRRPQHLMTRAANKYNVHFFEEPLISDKPDGYSSYISTEGIHIVIPNLKDEHAGGINKRLEIIFRSFLESECITNYIFWYYTPMMRNFTENFTPKLIVYDCMVNLDINKNGNSFMLAAETKLLKEAQLVFTSSIGLYKAKKNLHQQVSCYPGSVDFEHFAAARLKLPDPEDQKNIPYPRIGYFGIIDDRIDVALLKKLAELKAEYHFILIGPVNKIDPEKLPKNKNIHYLGLKNYEDLPAYCSNWDLAFSPFIINETTKYLSPANTPEYLAAGLPVVATNLEELYNNYGDADLVQIINNENDFITLAEGYLQKDDKIERRAYADSFLKLNSWDLTWEDIYTQMIIAMYPAIKKRYKFLEEYK